MTQQELSEKSGIIQPSIAKIENFVRTPQYTTLIFTATQKYIYYSLD